MWRSTVVSARLVVSCSGEGRERGELSRRRSIGKTGFAINQGNLITIQSVQLFTMEQADCVKREARCELCNESKINTESFCRQCGMYICKDCIIQHQRLKTYADHIVVSLASLKTELANSIFLNKPPATEICNDHEEPLAIFCFDCEKPICRDCTVKDHRNHNFEFIKKAAKDARRSLLENVVPLQKLTVTVHDTMADISNTKKELSMRREAAAFIIRASFKELRDILDSREEELLDEADTIAQQKMKKLSLQEKDLSIACADIEDVVDYTQLCVSNGTDDEVMSMLPELSRRIKQETTEHGNSEMALKPVESAAIEVQVTCYEDIQQLCLTQANVMESSMSIMNQSDVESIHNESNGFIIIKKEDYTIDDTANEKIKSSDSKKPPQNIHQNTELKAKTKYCQSSVKINGYSSAVVSTPVMSRVNGAAVNNYRSPPAAEELTSPIIAIPNLSTLKTLETSFEDVCSATDKVDVNPSIQDSKPTLPTEDLVETSLEDHQGADLNLDSSRIESNGKLSTIKMPESSKEDFTGVEKMSSHSSSTELESILSLSTPINADFIQELSPQPNIQDYRAQQETSKEFDSVLCSRKPAPSPEETLPALTTLAGISDLNPEVGKESTVTLTIGADLNSNPETSIHKVTSSLKSLHSGETTECVVNEIAADVYSIQFKPTVRGRHKLVVSVDDQQVEGSPFRIFVSISPYQLGYPVKIWRNIPVPKGVALTSEGKVIVATSAGNIVKLKKGGNYETILEQNTLRGLHKIEIDEENNIFCGSENNNIILRCDPDGENVRLQEIKHKNWPRGLAIIGKEVLITQGGNRGTIHVYNGHLKYIRSIQHHGDKACFWAITSDSQGHLYCADRNNSCIHVFNKHGSFIRSIGMDDPAVIDTPMGICVSGQYVYVCDEYRHSVLVFTTEGKYVTSFGHCGMGKGQFLKPTSICANKNGFLYVTDSENDRVQCF